jgi:MYXO-CTERM domain-containing protein
VVCAAPKRCSGGLCIDCYSTGCPTGQICVDGACQSSPCENKKCGETQYCNTRGECVDVCLSGCAANERCLSGRCSLDPCATIICNEAEVCDPDTRSCKLNVCKVKSCPGQFCVPLTGLCGDDPCKTVKCSGGPCYTCHAEPDGTGQCVFKRECLPSVMEITPGSGGCACTVGGRAALPAAGLGAALAVALLLMRRRRR